MASDPRRRSASRGAEPGARRRIRSGVVAGLALCASLAAAPFASAQPRPDAEALRDAARELGHEGVRRYEAGDWEGARACFRQAYRLMPAPTLALREARALVKLSRLVEAVEAYDRAASTGIDLSSPAPYRDAVTDALLEADALRPRIPRVLIKVKGADVASPGLSVRVDGVPVAASTLGAAHPVNPGTHRIEVIAKGSSRPVVETVSLRESDFRAVVLDVPPPAAGAAPSPPALAVTRARADAGNPADSQTIVGWTVLAAGGAGLAVGATTGILALVRKSDVDDACTGSRCPASAQRDIDAFRTLRTVSTVAYAGGALAAGVGVVLLLTAPDPPRRADSARITPWVGPGSAGVRGVF